LGTFLPNLLRFLAYTRRNLALVEGDHGIISITGFGGLRVGVR
jgi:hypothetical protein